MPGDRWPDSSDPPFRKRAAPDPQPKAKPRTKLESRQAPRPERTDDDSHPRKSLRKAITELIRADPDRMVKDISAELEGQGYQAPVDTVAFVRSEVLNGKAKPIKIEKPRSHHPTPSYRKARATFPRRG
jgi:hypothetical protein